MVEHDTRSTLAEVSVLLDTNRPAEATRRLSALIASVPPERLQLLAPDIRSLADRFLHKRRRQVLESLETRLGTRVAVKKTSPSEAPSIVIWDDTFEEDWSTRLDVLRDQHIFQWSTFYRETIGFIFKDLLQRAQDSERRADVTKAASRQIARHAEEIYRRGFDFLNAQQISYSATQAKSVSGLQRFLFLITDFYLQHRLEVANGTNAVLLREASSAMLSGVLRGYGRVSFDVEKGWDVLSRNYRSWWQALGFLTGSDADDLAFEGGAQNLPNDVLYTVVPVLMALDRMANKYRHGSFWLTRLSRLYSDTRRLDISLAGGAASRGRDLTISCFVGGEMLDLRPVLDAVASGAAIAVTPLSPQLGHRVTHDGIIDATRFAGSVDAHLHNVAERVQAALELRIEQSTSGTSDRLSRNYARDFPLEDPTLRRFFIVERSSVKRLLQMFEEGTGIHLWCSVRRSGKTTAASDLAGMTGRSVVTIQTMDQQPHQPELNILYERVLAAVHAREPLVPTFFFSTIDECAAASGTIHMDGFRRVLVIDEYESLFGLLNAMTRKDEDLRYLVVQPLLSQMVSFAVANLLILMGQRPDAHFILMAQNQLSPLVRQDQFPLFEHLQGGIDTEFARFVKVVLTENISFTPHFVDSVFAETSGHPYLTVNVLVDFCQWLIDNGTSATNLEVDRSIFAAFAKERLAQAALQRNPFYGFFKHMLGEYLSDLARQREPWLYAVATVLKRIGNEHPKSMSCPAVKFRELSEDVAAAAGLSTDQLLLGARMANFLVERGGHVKPAIPLLSRLTNAVQPEVN